jgi:succinate-semialdehyde dehydrogenase/glutarate-semialdehyde dehydrogenase
MGHIAMALVAGNTAICKSSELTPLIGQLIEETWRATQLPESVFSHIVGSADVGETLVSQHIDKLFFTGSVEICGESLIPCTLELGGKDAMIVLEDADLEQASSAAIWGAFTNCGQACASVERLYVHATIAEKLTSLIVEKTRKLRVGNGLDPSIDIGPLSNKEQLDKVMAHVEDAVSRGAEVLTGGGPPTELPGYFFAPTVLSRVNHSFLCMREETFGPLLPIMNFTSDAQAISLVNDTTYGLTASLWSRNRYRAETLARQLNAGTLMINECVYTHAICQTPWGGDGDSGIGRSHGQIGLMECVRTHHLHIHSTKMKSLWWFPYNASVVRAFKWMTQTLTGPVWRWILSTPAFVYLLFRKKT